MNPQFLEPPGLVNLQLALGSWLIMKVNLSVMVG